MKERTMSLTVHPSVHQDRQASSAKVRQALADNSINEDLAAFLCIVKQFSVIPIYGNLKILNRHGRLGYGKEGVSLKEMCDILLSKYSAIFR